MANEIELNGLADINSLPEDWKISLINPVTLQPAQNIVVARFIEQLTSKMPIVTKEASGLLSSNMYNTSLFSRTVIGGHPTATNSPIKDFNEVKETGIYGLYLDDSYINGPSNVKFGNMLVFEYTNFITQLVFERYGSAYFRIRNDNYNWSTWQKFAFSNAAFSNISLESNALTDTITDNYSILPPPPQIACQTIQNQQVRTSNLRYPLCRKQTTRMVQFQLKVNHQENSMSGRLTRSEKLSWNYRKKTRDLNKSSISLTIARYNKCNLPRAGPPRLIN